MSHDGETSPPVVEMAQMAVEAKNEQDVSKSPVPEDAASANGQSTGNFKDSFKAFSKFGDIKSDGKHITLSQSDKWMKQAKVNEDYIKLINYLLYLINFNFNFRL